MLVRDAKLRKTLKKYYICDMENEIFCNIVLDDGSLSIIDLLKDYNSVYLIIDRNVESLFENSILKRLNDSGKIVGLFRLDANEANKSLETVSQIVGEMLELSLNRDAFVLGIGGGITTDLAGFVSSIYKRGVSFGFVPTTLLSQVDAAIGGKNGVNYKGLKNMLGVIAQPKFSLISPNVLKTLPKSVFLEGVSELLKTFIIADSDAYYTSIDLLVNGLKGKILSGEDSLSENSPITEFVKEEFSWERFTNLSYKAAKIKANIVQQDPYEHGLRRVLNLGHTFAHAIETLSARCDTSEAATENLSKKVDISKSEYGRISHGDAVAMGIILSTLLSDDKTLYARLKQDFEFVGLPTNCPFEITELASVMKKDKKAEGKIVHFVVPQAIGYCEIIDFSVGEVVARIINR